jgi:proteasome lid subunit RPN8/RPN11
MEGNMIIQVPADIMEQIRKNGEKTYPEEGAGLMLGLEENGIRTVEDILVLENAREDGTRHNRYLITAEDMLQGEKEAANQDLSIIGIFHSHPDHPNRPSEFDQEFAVPWYSYLITSIHNGKAGESCSWRLVDDRSGFESEEIQITSSRTER